MAYKNGIKLPNVKNSQKLKKSVILVKIIQKFGKRYFCKKKDKQLNTT